tara:strand:+ start:34 stop:375 length:342 start_codon:yes stop_codon:yes gene_type:complete
MKKILILILFFLSTHAFSQKITVLYLNTPWNSRNDYKDLNQLYGADILKVDYDAQPANIREAVRSIPAIIVLRDGRPVATWQADISMKLKVRYETVQEIINNAKAPLRRASTN